jgi:hypothetical protein
MHRYRVDMCSIDAQPEHRLAGAFADRFPGRVYLLNYTGPIDEVVEPVLDERRAAVGRTQAIDAMLAEVRLRRNELPRVLPADYSAHLQAAIRLIDRDSLGRKRPHYHSLVAWGVSMGSFRGGPVFPAIFVGTVGGLLASHLPGFPEGAAVATVMAATVAAVLRLPLASVVIALTLSSSAGADATPLIIVAAAVSYIMVDVLEGRQGRPAAETPTAGGASSPPTPSADGQPSVSITPRASSK